MKSALAALLLLGVMSSLASAQKDEVVRNVHEVNDDGSYRIEYETRKGEFKFETKDAQGNVRGKYGYFDDHGKLKTVEYASNNQTGFKILTDEYAAPTGVEVPALPLPKEDTKYSDRPEVIKLTERESSYLKPRPLPSQEELIEAARAVERARQQANPGSAPLTEQQILALQSKAVPAATPRTEDVYKAPEPKIEPKYPAVKAPEGREPQGDDIQQQILAFQAAQQAVVRKQQEENRIRQQEEIRRQKEAAAALKQAVPQPEQPARHVAKQPQQEQRPYSPLPVKPHPIEQQQQHHLPVQSHPIEQQYQQPQPQQPQPQDNLQPLTEQEIRAISSRQQQHLPVQPHPIERQYKTPQQQHLPVQSHPIERQYKTPQQQHLPVQSHPIEQQQQRQFHAQPHPVQQQQQSQNGPVRTKAVTVSLNAEQRAFLARQDQQLALVKDRIAEARSKGAGDGISIASLVHQQRLADQQARLRQQQQQQQQQSGLYAAPQGQQQQVQSPATFGQQQQPRQFFQEAQQQQRQFRPQGSPPPQFHAQPHPSAGGAPHPHPQFHAQPHPAAAAAGGGQGQKRPIFNAALFDPSKPIADQFSS